MANNFLQVPAVRLWSAFARVPVSRLNNNFFKQNKCSIRFYVRFVTLLEGALARAGQASYEEPSIITF